MSKRFEKTEEVDHTVEFTRELVKSARGNRVNLWDYTKLCDRCDAYFDACAMYKMRPTVGDLSIALGVDRRILSMIASGNYKTHPKYATLPSECVEEIRLAYISIGAIIEQAMLQGKVHPVSGIFLAKNMGYKDYNNDFERENMTQEKADIKALEKKYLAQLPDFTKEEDS